MKASRFYRTLKWVATKALHVYFNKIEIVGEENLPDPGIPYLLACNHQNAFLDAIIVGALLPKPLHFLTRSDVFTVKSSYWLKKMNMMPIYRIRDGFSELGKNEEIFDRCAELFNKGESIMIFSEGNHGEHYYLRPLTKGTSRIALDAQKKLDKDLMIVPCGLNFFSHRKPRTKLIIAYGEPISVRDFLDTYKEDKQAGLKNLKDVLSEGMKKCLVIPEKTEDYDVKVRKVFNIKNEVLTFKKLKEFADRDYSNDQTKFIKPKKPNPTALWWASLPNWGPLWLLRNVLGEFKDKVFWGSMKFAVMLAVMPIWWILSMTLGWILFGFWEGIVLVFLSVVGLFARAELLKQS